MIVAVVALFLGLVVIALLARFAHNVPRVDARAARTAPDARPPIPPAELARTLEALLPALGLDVLSGSRSKDQSGAIEMTCLDARPVTGGRVLVRANSSTAGGQVDAAEVLAFAEGVRSESGALKGLFVAAAGFTDEAYAALGASPALVELIDGSRLVDLVRQHVPEHAAVLEQYRFFSAGARRHGRATSSSGPVDASAVLSE